MSWAYPSCGDSDCWQCYPPVSMPRALVITSLRRRLWAWLLPILRAIKRYGEPRYMTAAEKDAMWLTAQRRVNPSTQSGPTATVKR